MNQFLAKSSLLSSCSFVLLSFTFFAAWQDFLLPDHAALSNLATSASRAASRAAITCRPFSVTSYRCVCDTF
jgi:hypothetical protein